ncbi:MAG: hypothetical protein IT529_10415 [Burkholderiales bacterium]|nr:hypothetical protein [Burkholderiales bacterium]
MSKLASTVYLSLISFVAFAAAMDDAANAPPAEGVSVLIVWLFLIGFIAMIVGFLGYMWWVEKKKKAQR